MPTSEQPEGGSTGGKKRSRSKPTSKARRKRQSTKDRYAHAREDAQLEGLIPTTPEEALTDERVPPSAQANQPMPGLIAEAIRKGWSVPPGLKPQLVDELIGVILDPEARTKDKIAAFNALRGADRSQWEQDNPVDAGKAKGAVNTVSVSVQANMIAINALREALERDVGGGETALPAPAEPGPPSHSRFDGQVEVGAASTTD